MRHTVLKALANKLVLCLSLSMFSALALANPSLDNSRHVAVARIQVPADEQLQALVEIAVYGEPGAITVALQQHQSLQLRQINWSPDKVVIIGHRLVRKNIAGSGSATWLEEVRVTVPRPPLANSWDVQSLQKELERLGIKVKPKPPAPRPTQQLSG